MVHFSDVSRKNNEYAKNPLFINYLELEPIRFYIPMRLLSLSFLIVFLAIFLGRLKSQTSSADAYRQAIRETHIHPTAVSKIPLIHLDKQRIAHLVLGDEDHTATPFSVFLDKYAPVSHFHLAADAVGQLFPKWVRERRAEGFTVLILELRQENLSGSIPSDTLRALLGELPIIKVLFGGKSDSISGDAIWESDIRTGRDYWHQSLAAQLIFGGVDLSTGEATRGIRLGYASLENVGIRAVPFRDSVAAIIREGIAAGAFPGAQVLVARRGQIVYHEAFGKHTYEGEQLVGRDDLYDLASVTKISSGLAALMKWYGEGSLDLDAPLVRYLPETRGSNKENLKMRDILTHQARLRAWIPFWKGTLRGCARNPWQRNWDANRDNDYRFKARTFRRNPSARYPIAVPGGLWLHRKYPDKMASYIYRSPLNAKPGFVYSDFFFILMPRLLKFHTGQPFEAYLKENFYRPLGASTLTWNPLRYFPRERIVPTEKDTFFRMTLLQGEVHDEGAAMLGGISGHAGLFGSANDLVKLLQMYLNGGLYGGERLLTEKALKTFTACPYCPENHRGIGFDKPQFPWVAGKSTMARDVSPESFGHSGYTGTFVWVDPREELIYLFFSNRVYPTRERRAIYDLGIRPRIHQALYEALER